MSFLLYMKLKSGLSDLTKNKSKVIPLIGLEFYRVMRRRYIKKINVIISVQFILCKTRGDIEHKI
jgi:hypothetical protein